MSVAKTSAPFSAVCFVMGKIALLPWFRLEEPDVFVPARGKGYLHAWQSFLFPGLRVCSAPAVRALRDRFLSVDNQQPKCPSTTTLSWSAAFWGSCAERRVFQRIAEIGEDHRRSSGLDYGMASGRSVARAQLGVAVKSLPNWVCGTGSGREDK